MADTSDERALATDLGTRTDVQLAELFEARSVSPTAPWRGFFDAAEGLLDAASIDRALVRLPRTELAALVSGDVAETGGSREDPVVRARLHELALADAAGTVFAAVEARVRDAAPLAAASTEAADADAASTASGTASTGAATLADPPPAGEAAEAAAAERALTAVAALSDLLMAAQAGGITTTASGAVSAADRRRLVEHGLVADGDELDDLLVAASDAGLLRVADREWRVTEAGEAWLPHPSLDRWTAIAHGLRDRLPRGLRTADGGFLPAPAWAGVYPLDPAWPEQATALRRRAIRWGLLAPDDSEPAWGRALRTGADAASDRLAALLPTEIDRVYLQADLSAIAPGPLEAALDLRLRTMAARESRAQASTYRFSAESLAGAVAAGETAESIRDFLAEISLTGIPQPLAYLVERAARQHGMARVRWDAATERTRVESDDAHLRETIAIDRGLRAVGLVDDGEALVSRVGRDAVYWALIDARYPAVAVDARGEPEPLRRRGAVADVPAETDYTLLLQTLRAASDTDTDAAWLERELDQAVRARGVIDVDVKLPDGSTRTFTLEAAGLGGGRLRGRDRAADVERTLPVSSIVSVRPGA